MGFRFRHRIKILPGIYINLGKRGANSLSFRAGPFTTNVNEKGVKHTTGLHGTGLSYETKRKRTGRWEVFVGTALILLVVILFVGG